MHGSGARFPSPDYLLGTLPSTFGPLGPAVAMATPMQTQEQQGGYSIVPSGAATPVPVGEMPPAQAAQAVPDGRSPNGKRPRSQLATSSASGPSMTLAETATAVLEMRPLVQSTAEAVQWNCDLLNALITRAVDHRVRQFRGDCNSQAG